MNFRYDINGLRAIAVLAVVIFHFNPDLVPGGFAGVDVFFVISGYLMTRIIFKGLENDTFNLIKFYIDRANRIIPALAFLCLIVLVFGWYNLSPIDYKSLGKHVTSSVSFVSNMVYWRESGYFDSESHSKWLLHTWSLSVEWQFYIIYPLILITIKRLFSINACKTAITLVTLVGFVTSVFITLKWPDSAYYLLPTRAWEMLAGALTYIYPLSASPFKKRLIEVTGLVLIACSYFIFSSDTPWPGYLAIFPVFGTCLVILANQQNSLITKNILFKYIGKWSYSIYLWHWPIVVFGHYHGIDNWYIYGFVISVAAGYLSYRFIESINFNKIHSWRKSFKSTPLLMSVTFIFIGTFIWHKNGYLGQLPLNIYSKMEVDMKSMNNYVMKKHTDLSKKGDFTTNNKRVLVIGDSQSADFTNILLNSDANKDIEIATILIPYDCGNFYIPKEKREEFLSPNINEDYRPGDDGTSKCPKIMDSAIKSNLIKSADYIFLSQKWRASTLPYIGGSLEKLRQITNAKITIVGNKDIISKKPSDIIFIAHKERGNENQIASSFIDKSRVNISDEIEKITQKQKLQFINMSKEICSKNNCLVTFENEIIFYDLYHLTPSGTKYLAFQLNDVILKSLDLL